MKLKSYKLFIEIHNASSYENNDYEKTSWSDTIDGKDVTITIQEIENYLDKIGENIIEIPVDEIFHLCAHRNKTDEKTLSRSRMANLEFPIIVSKNENGKYNMILDGQHRILKAKNNNLQTIKARVLDLKYAPEIYKKMFY
jgi:queuine/archaeosine tRNA-ribosyltransferase